MTFLQTYSQEIMFFLTIVPPIVGSIFWSHKKLHADIQEIRADVKSAHSRIDAMGQRIDAMGQRIDDMGHRIDGVYQVIMEMLRKKD